MAGYSKLYCVGEPGGYMGADGVNPIYFQILVGDADRQLYEVHYFDQSIKPLGRVNRIVPEGPNHPNALIDSCIAFFPSRFQDCPSFSEVSNQLTKVEMIDFHLGVNVPPEWTQLREEARESFNELCIFEAELSPLELGRHEDNG